MEPCVLALLGHRRSPPLISHFTFPALDADEPYRMVLVLRNQPTSRISPGGGLAREPCKGGFRSQKSMPREGDHGRAAVPLMAKEATRRRTWTRTAWFGSMCRRGEEPHQLSLIWGQPTDTQMGVEGRFEGGGSFFRALILLCWSSFFVWIYKKLWLLEIFIISDSKKTYISIWSAIVILVLIMWKIKILPKC
jgi:hypothetical protein